MKRDNWLGSRQLANGGSGGAAMVTDRPLTLSSPNQSRLAVGPGALSAGWSGPRLRAAT